MFGARTLSCLIPGSIIPHICLVTWLYMIYVWSVVWFEDLPQLHAGCCALAVI